MKQYKNGLYVGKFMAYHQGHQYCINNFATQCEKLNLVLCRNTKTDRVEDYVRRQWLEQDLKSGLRIQKKKIRLFTHTEDGIPPYPDGIVEWCKSIEDLIGTKIDVMFGNDEYIEECAKVFGASYCIPDSSRSRFNISSTKILDNKLKYYNFLAEVSKPFFNKKILFTGPESTGKSTIARQLTNYFNGKYIGEYGRKFQEETIKKFNKRATQWTVNDFFSVAQTHNEEIMEAFEKPVRLLFVDTDAIITQTFCELYLKKYSNIFDPIITNQNFDLIFYLSPFKTEWKSDGVRELENSRDMVGEIIKSKLNQYDKKYLILDNHNGYENRFERAKQIIMNTFKISH